MESSVVWKLWYISACHGRAYLFTCVSNLLILESSCPILQCLRPPYGVLYLATKRNYVSSNSGARHLKSLVDEEGIFGAHLVKEMNDREIWKFFLK